MSEIQGSITGPQMEILEAVWESGPGGATVAEIWQRIAQRRGVARTTVLTMISRLAQRGWLERKETGRSLRYVATCTKEQTTGQVANQLVDMVFGGSASELVRSLLGSRPVSPEEVRRLRELLDKMETEGQP